jgi:hypothetical protein
VIPLFVGTRLLLGITACSAVVLIGLGVHAVFGQV